MLEKGLVVLSKEADARERDGFYVSEETDVRERDGFYLPEATDVRERVFLFHQRKLTSTVQYLDGLDWIAWLD